MKKILLSSLLCFFTAPLFAQELQSLLEQLPKLKDTAEIKMLNEISAQYSGSNASEARKYAKRALALAQEQNYQDGEAVAYYRLAQTVVDESEAQLAYYQKWLKVRLKQGDATKTSWALETLMDWHRNLGQEKQMRKYFNKAVRINAKVGHYERIARMAKTPSWYYLREEKDLKAWFEIEKITAQNLKKGNPEKRYAYAYTLFQDIEHLAYSLEGHWQVPYKDEEKIAAWINDYLSYGVKLLAIYEIEELYDAALSYILTVQSADLYPPLKVEAFLKQRFEFLEGKQAWKEWARTHRLAALIYQHQQQYRKAAAAYQQAFFTALKGDAEMQARWSFGGMQQLIRDAKQKGALDEKLRSDLQKSLADWRKGIEEQKQVLPYWLERLAAELE